MQHRRKRKSYYGQRAFLLRATAASIGGERLRRGKRERFGEHESSAAEDEGALVYFPFLFSPLLFFAAAFSGSLTKESYGLEKLDRAAHVGPTEIFGWRADAY